jgi:L-ectoine synthase
MGFSMHDTLIRANTETRMWYKYHLEAVYCVAGTGEIEDLETGLIHPVGNGTLYALDQHDRHIVRSKTDMRLVCVFNPPLTGQEVHNAEGAYPLAETEALEN